MATSWTLLTLTREFCKRRKLPIPSEVVASTDEHVVQVWGLLNETLEHLISLGDWPELHLPISFVHVGGFDYLAYEFSAGSASVDHPGLHVRAMLSNTLWDQTNQRPVNGPLTPAQWRQAIVQSTASGTQWNWMRSTTGIHIYPEPDPPGNTIFVFDAIHSQPIINTGTYKDIFDDDDDTMLLPGALVLGGVNYRWRKEKGLDYTEEKSDYIKGIVERLGRGLPSGDLSLDNDGYAHITQTPGVFVPSGDWLI